MRHSIFQGVYFTIASIRSITDWKKFYLEHARIENLTRNQNFAVSKRLNESDQRVPVKVGLMIDDRAFAAYDVNGSIAMELYQEGCQSPYRRYLPSLRDSSSEAFTHRVIDWDLNHLFASRGKSVDVWPLDGPEGDVLSTASIAAQASVIESIQVYQDMLCIDLHQETELWDIQKVTFLLFLNIEREDPTSDSSRRRTISRPIRCE